VPGERRLGEDGIFQLTHMPMLDSIVVSSITLFTKSGTIYCTRKLTIRLGSVRLEFERRVFLDGVFFFKKKKKKKNLGGYICYLG